MQIIVKTILNANSIKLLNSAISYTNTFYNIIEVTKTLRRRLHNLNLHNEYCINFINANEVNIQNKHSKSIIAIITKIT